MTTTTILRLPAVCDRTGLSRSTVYAEIAANRFPRPIKLAGGSAAGWVEAEIEAYIASRIAERDAEPDKAA